MYTPTTWYVCKDALADGVTLTSHALPLDNGRDKRLFFVDEQEESGSHLLTEGKRLYLDKSVAGLKKVQRSQYPTTYVDPLA